MKLLASVLLSLVLVLAPKAAFADKVFAAVLMVDRATSGTTTAIELGGINRTYFAYGSTSASTGSCIIKIQVSNDNATFIDMGTITLTLGTAVTADGIASMAPWKYARANQTSISGTGAKCSLMVGSTGK